MAGRSIIGQSEQLAAGSRFFSHLLSRVLEAGRLWSDELDRSLAATQRYEQLRIRPGTDLSLRDRASKARAVFVEMYASEENSLAARGQSKRIS